jgi:hypothetical protein
LRQHHSFEDSWWSAHPLTSDKPLPHAAISGIYVGGGTKAWDAATQGLENVNAPSRSGRKAVMLMADGDAYGDSITLGQLARFPFDAAGIVAAFPEFRQAHQGGYQILWRSNYQPGERIDVIITYNGVAAEQARNGGAAWAAPRCRLR